MKITVHPGVELLTIVQKLAGKDQPSTPTSYEREVLAYFALYKQHPVVRQVWQFKGTVYPDLTELSFCFTDAPDPQLTHLPNSSSWDKYYGQASVAEYLRQCQDFAAKAILAVFTPRTRPPTKPGASKFGRASRTTAC